MGDTKKIMFNFNTAITGLSKESGTWNENLHNQTVMPLRGLVMQIDGVTGCFISRYGMEITYIPGITSKKSIIAAARAAVGTATGMDNFFPLRGRKTPVARIPRRPKSVYNTWWVARVDFNTDLFVNMAVSSEELTAPLVARLAKADGARQPGVGQRVAYVKFDRRQASPESMKAHLENVVGEIMAEREAKGYFPFADSTFSYRTYATNSVI